MTKLMEVQFCAPPNYQHLIAEIYYDGEHFGELNTEKGFIELMVFPRNSGDPWSLPVAEVIDGLCAAEAQFRSRSAYFDSPDASS